MAKNWTIERKTVAGFATALAVLSLVAGVSVRSTLSLLKNWDEVAHTHQVLDGISNLQSDIIQLAIDARLYTANENEATFEEWDHTRGNVDSIMTKLRSLTVDNSGQQTRLANLQAILDQFVKPTVRNANRQMLESLWKKGALLPAVEIILAMDGEERALLVGRGQRVKDTAYETLGTIGIASVLAVVLVGGSAMLIMRDLRNRRKAEIELQRARKKPSPPTLQRVRFSPT